MPESIIDELLKRRSRCLTTDRVAVEDDYSDILLAEDFRHHRVLLAPIAIGGSIHAVVSRHAFLRMPDGRFGEIAEEDTR